MREREFGNRDSPSTKRPPIFDGDTKHPKSATKTYANIQFFLGVLGIVFPFVFLLPSIFGDQKILPSISDYYFTKMNLWLSLIHI